MNNEKIIRAEKLFRSYQVKYYMDNKKNEIPVLKGIDLEVEEKEFVAIMGKSGCGKTTLLKVLGLIDKPTKGNVYFKGKNTKKLWEEELADIRRRKIGFIFQDFYLMDSLSVRENIMLPMILDKRTDETCIKRSEEYAERFEINQLLEKHPFELSGGEKQRVAICRALINNPDLILADEPTGNLDSKSRQIVIESLNKINQEYGKTIIMVTHDAKMASYSERTILLKDGLVLNTLIAQEDRNEFYQTIVGQMENL